jgi:hypothetical protein
MEKWGLKHVLLPYILVLVSYDQPFISHLSGIDISKKSFWNYILFSFGVIVTCLLLVSDQYQLTWTMQPQVVKYAAHWQPQMSMSCCLAVDNLKHIHPVWSWGMFWLMQSLVICVHYVCLCQRTFSLVWIGTIGCCCAYTRRFHGCGHAFGSQLLEPSPSSTQYSATNKPSATRLLFYSLPIIISLISTSYYTFQYCDCYVIQLVMHN